MAAPVAAQCNQKLSHKQFRAALKKERRKKKRQAFAKQRDAELPEEEDTLQDDELEEERRAEEERQRLHLEWFEKEKIAQEEFRLRREKEEAARLKREEEEWRIKEEWEEQQKKEQHEKEKKQQEKRDREMYTKRYSAADRLVLQNGDEAVQKMLDQAESQLENGGTWHNPEAPVDYGTEKDRANCPFYLKTGACRFGDRCSRKHAHPASSPTLMIRGMFVTFGIEQSRRDDYDTDASLEYSEEEVHQQFLDFYEDVLPEFKSVGKVLQFKVSCNFEPHLRGNVYIQFQTDDECREAFMLFNGRYYAGRQLQCEFCPVTRWKTAICGLFDRQKCPRGKHCNFLHVYRNPDNQFWEADRDFHMSPDRSSQYSGRFSERFSERYSERRGRSFQHSDYKFRRQHSCSPGSSRRRNGESDRRAGNRSRSRERLRSQRSRSHSKERGKSRAERSRSKERRRSNSRERFSTKRERRSRNRSRTRSKSRDKKRLSKSPRESRKRTRNRSRSKSHSGSGDGRSCSKGRSPSQTEIRKARSRNSERIDCKSPWHKHSKKSKKKKQKKDKKKNRSLDKKQSPDSLKKHSEDDKNSPPSPVEKDFLMEDGTQQDVSSVAKNSGTVLESDPALEIPENQQEDNVHKCKT